MSGKGRTAWGLLLVTAGALAAIVGFSDSLLSLWERFFAQQPTHSTGAEAPYLTDRDRAMLELTARELPASDHGWRIAVNYGDFDSMRALWRAGIQPNEVEMCGRWLRMMDLNKLRGLAEILPSDSFPSCRFGSVFAERFGEAPMTVGYATAVLAQEMSVLCEVENECPRIGEIVDRIERARAAGFSFVGLASIVERFRAVLADGDATLDEIRSEAALNACLNPEEGRETSLGNYTNRAEWTAMSFPSLTSGSVRSLDHGADPANDVITGLYVGLQWPVAPRSVHDCDDWQRHEWFVSTSACRSACRAVLFQHRDHPACTYSTESTPVGVIEEVVCRQPEAARINQYMLEQCVPLNVADRGRVCRSGLTRLADQLEARLRWRSRLDAIEAAALGRA